MHTIYFFQLKSMILAMGYAALSCQRLYMHSFKFKFHCCTVALCQWVHVGPRWVWVAKIPRGLLMDLDSRKEEEDRGGKDAEIYIIPQVSKRQIERLWGTKFPTSTNFVQEPVVTVVPHEVIHVGNWRDFISHSWLFPRLSVSGQLHSRKYMPVKGVRIFFSSLSSWHIVLLSL